MSRGDISCEGLPEYADAESYDLENVWATDDDFYLALAQEIGGPVLDVGCGTGRLARAIAATGIEVVGLDVTPAMLKRARSLSTSVDIGWINGDARTMRLGRKFRLILMTGHAFQHMLTDVDIGAFFDRAHEHLLDDGYLAFETRNFAAKTFAPSEELTHWRSFQDGHGRSVDILLGGRYDPESEIEHLTEVQVIRGGGERWRATSSLRYVSVEHLNHLLNLHGLTVVKQFGDWTRGPLAPDQPEVITICQPS